LEWEGIVSRVRKYAIAGSTFSIAMAIGFVMQNGDALASRMIGDEDMAEVPVPPMQFPQQASVAVTIPNIPEIATEAAPEMALPTLGPVAEPSVPPVDLASAEDSVGTPAIMSDAIPDIAENGVVCVPDLSAQVAEAAMVSLVLDAPCSANSVATIHHQGMIFSAVVDQNGIAAVQVPALAEDAVFIAELPGGSGAAAIARVPEIANFDRAVLQWQGQTGLQIHALEFGASYDEAGHVWSASSRSAEAALNGEGGFMVSLGAAEVDNAYYAEVYTFPSGMISGSGEVEITVEAEILPTTCGREISAQTIQIAPGQEPYALDLTMTLPGCETVGEFLVLKNMLESLTLASR
jgi:hypothetical protein